jgi:Ca2+-binding RTX toxin-like protein
VTTAHASGGITGLGSEAITLSDTTLTALILNGVDSVTSGVVKATALTTLTGDFAGIALAMGSAGITTSGTLNVTMTDTAANLTTQTYAAAGASDTLHVGVAGAATDLTTLTGFETITLAGSTDTTADTVSIADGAGTAVSATGAVGVALGSGGQVFTGSAGADVVAGGSGADTITGGDGADTITGGAGHDTIHLSDADSAVDVVVIDSASGADADSITGFVSGEDLLELSIAGLGLNGADYTVGAVAGISASAAAALGSASWSNYIVIDTAANIAALVTTGGTGAVLAFATDTGNVSWDADGDFSAGLVIVGNAYALLAGDFAIVT